MRGSLISGVFKVNGHDLDTKTKEQSDCLFLNYDAVK